MAHFAEIDQNNVVNRVIVVSDTECLDAQGNFVEALGATFCTNLLGGTWIQTSYNSSIRKNYAGIGYTYDEIKDAFISPNPYPSWVLNEATCNWEPPVFHPLEGMHTWNEDTLTWIQAVYE